MENPQNYFDKVFLQQQYTLHYKRAARVKWVSEARVEYVVVFALDGNLRGGFAETRQTLEEEEQLLPANSTLLLDPGMRAEMSGHEVDFLVLTLAPSFVIDCAVRIGLVTNRNSIAFGARIIELDERLVRAAREVREELQQAEFGQAVMLTSLIEQITVHLLRRYANVRRVNELELSRVGLVDRRIRRAVELMHARLEDELSIEELAGAAYLSPFHFARLFKKLTGASPHAYLAALRHARAQKLLAETDLSITEISARVGYSSPSHFTRAFRQATGLTPRAFRSALIKY
jgi:AraC family transcriptional regulator